MQYISKYRLDHFAVVLILIFAILMSSGQLLAGELDCNGVSVWSASQVYTGGEEVQYNGNKYRANYWTQNNNPEQYSDPYEHWTNLGPCGGGGTNQPPSVSLTSPANGATYTEGDNIQIQATASDSNGSVSRVEFYQGSTKLGEDNTSPYSFTLNNASVGSFTFTAKAFDNEGASKTSSAVSVTVSGSGGDSCSGLPQYVAGNVYSQDQEVQNINKKYRCNVPGWCSSNAAWAYAPGEGQHWQDAWTYLSECGGGGDDNENPSVSITSPVNGSTYTAGDNVTITANASDTDGTVSKVEFFRNGSKIGEDTTSPYEINWVSLAGNYSLTAKATDNDGGATTSESVSIIVESTGGGGGDLPKRLMVGYWHNFNNGSGTLKLRDVSDKWDVINIAFAEPSTPSGSNMTFTPDPAIYPSIQEFKDDVALLKSRGKKVLISIGGANGAIDVSSSADAQAFSSSMISLINEYGFSGMDIDLEGSSLSLVSGDTDFRNPTSPKIVHFIAGAQTVINSFSSDFILSMAPETAFVQGGYSTYAGAYGAYLPVIYAFRNQMDYIHVQHYNSGCMLGLDGRCYSQSTPDFHVAMAEMLLQGFPVASNPTSFPALRADQVAIGLPAAPAAAGGGYTTPANVYKALDYLIKGTPFRGNYTLINSSGYANFRGLMTWSINWDIANGYEFSNSYRPYLDALDAASIARIASEEEQPVSAVDKAIGGYPNPFVHGATVDFHVERSGYTSLVVYDNVGKRVTVFMDGVLESGHHSVEWNAGTIPSGVYFLQLTAEDGKVTNYKMYKE
ncbi:T9SS type A sorting domain-containing protein [Fulvivirga sp. 29W222]|uniref:T9SS type A sorting domain-containing protein n=1 Tax=Fulvivirga marina TaxID=2494733 RepID=A0A937KB93_9BACT|nr:Ig-like domain-containing protein [Fulvivirga marina]MBL6445624.1 T9SS type A sorting domain-containing protein [Fulvivirga marina]